MSQPKYRLTIDGQTQLVDIEEVETPTLGDQLSMRIEDVAGNVRAVDSQLGEVLMRLDRLEAKMQAAGEQQ